MLIDAYVVFAITLRLALLVIDVGIDGPFTWNSMFALETCWLAASVATTLIVLKYGYEFAALPGSGEITPEILPLAEFIVDPKGTVLPPNPLIQSYL